RHRQSLERSLKKGRPEKAAGREWTGERAPVPLLLTPPAEMTRGRNPPNSESALGIESGRNLSSAPGPVKKDRSVSPGGRLDSPPGDPVRRRGHGNFPSGVIRWVAAATAADAGWAMPTTPASTSASGSTNTRTAEASFATRWASRFPAASG